MAKTVCTTVENCFNQMAIPPSFEEYKIIDLSLAFLFFLVLTQQGALRHSLGLLGGNIE